MLINRPRPSGERPYNVQFFRDETVGIQEQIVATNALSPSPEIAERIKLDDEMINQWAWIAAEIRASDQHNNVVKMDKSTIKILGGGLLHYADFTNEELERMQSSNGPHSQAYTYRRIEGVFARHMLMEIERFSISVPKLWRPLNSNRQKIGY